MCVCAAVSRSLLKRKVFSQPCEVPNDALPDCTSRVKESPGGCARTNIRNIGLAKASSPRNCTPIGGPPSGALVAASRRGTNCQLQAHGAMLRAAGARCRHLPRPREPALWLDSAQHRWFVSSGAEPAAAPQDAPSPLESPARRSASHDPAPLWPPPGVVGGPVYPQQQQQRSGGTYDPLWAGPGDGVTGPTVFLLSTTSSMQASRPARPPEAGNTSSKAQAPVLQASAFSPDKLRALGIGGLDDALQALFRRAFASRALPPDVAAQLGVQHVKGILLHGPPGTGKSLIARKLGTMLASGRQPRVVNGPELLSRWVGSSEENVRQLFADAESDYNRHGDAADLHVLIFDEIDALCRRRGGDSGGNGGNSVGDSVVNQLLTKLDGVNSVPNILVIGLTNRRDLLDDALLRPGRLEVQLEIGLPDASGRAAILNIHTQAMRNAGLIASDVELAALAHKARNFSGAELAGVVRAAASFAMDRLLRRNDRRHGRAAVADDTRMHGMHGRGLGLGDVTVTKADFDSALDEIKPALGTAAAGAGLRQVHAPRGLIPVGPRFEAAQEALRTLTAAVEHAHAHAATAAHRSATAVSSQPGSVTSVLLVGPPGTGKTALAAAAADSVDFPFVRFVAPGAVSALYDDGSGGSALASALATAFQDAHKSSGAVLVLDDVERLLGYSPVGPAYSNDALQALLVLLRQRPPNGRHLLVLATSSCSEAMSQLGVTTACSASIHVHPLSTVDEKATALRASGAFASDDDVIAAAAQLPADVPIKHLLDVVDLAVRHGHMLRKTSQQQQQAGVQVDGLGVRLTSAAFMETVRQFTGESRA